MKWIFKPLLLGAGLCCFTINAAGLAKKPAVSVQFHGNYISLSAKTTVNNAHLSIAGPGGYYLQKSQQDGLPSMYLDKKQALVDGDYTYEITGHTGPVRLVKDTMNNGRGENNFTYAGTPIKVSGHFKVQNGQVKTYKKLKEPQFGSR